MVLCGPGPSVSSGLTPGMVLARKIPNSRGLHPAESAGTRFGWSRAESVRRESAWHRPSRTARQTMFDPVLSTHQKALQINLDPRTLRHVRRDRRRAGGRALVLPRRRRRRHDRQEHVGLRHDGQRRHLRPLRALRLPRAAGGDARPRVRAAARAPARQARRPTALLRLRRHRRGAQLHGHQRVPRLDGRPVPDRRPGRRPSEIIIHVRMLDTENVLQQEALGIVGVNLLYGAFYLPRTTRAR